MTKEQDKVIQLLDAAEPKENLKKWLVGYIPKHYKRLSVDLEEAKSLAIEGASEALAYFNTKLYFTQALIMGAVVTGKYKKIIVVTTSQYGKSWLCGQIALWLANRNRQVYVAGGNSNTTEIIMEKVNRHVQSADKEITDKLIGKLDKLEKLQTSLSKKKLSFKGGGLVEGISLGDTFNDPLKGNQAVGRGGDFIVDEASLIGDDAYAEMGRREFANETGEAFISLEISNPHNPGRFFDKLTAEVVPKDTLVVWMDVRTAFEEGRVKSKEQVIEGEWFQNKSTCVRYLLCELEDYSEESLFSPVIIDDTKDQEGLTYFLGVDSAYKGKDGIIAVLASINEENVIRIEDHVKIDKGEWVDGVTSEKIINQLLLIIHTFDIKLVCVDIGFGVYIVEGLAKKATDFTVVGINFGSGTTSQRKELNHYSAVYGANMRAEMHLDLADLIDSEKVTMTSEISSVLREQMNAVKIVHTAGDVKPKTRIIPKDKIKKVIGKSPDELDAALLAVHAVILYSLDYTDVSIYA